MFLALVTFIIVDAVINLRIGPCGCGKRKHMVWRFWWLSSTHSKAFMLYVELIANAVFLVWSLIETHWIITGWALWFTWSAMRAYYHEKDRLHNVIRSSGRVIVNEQGRLRVEH